MRAHTFLFFLLSLHSASAFLAPARPAAITSSKLQAHFEDPTFLLSVIDTFPGTDVVDPVVVSDVFWGSLKTKFLSLLLGQFLAFGVFAFITSIASQQLQKLLSGISGIFFEEKKTTLKMPPANYNPDAPDFGKLLVCLIIDSLGTGSELIPFIGEFTDIAYAPVAAFALRKLFGNSNAVFLLEFGEEILPFTDILPLATICWTVEAFFPSSDLAKLLQIGQYSERLIESEKDNL